MRSTQYAHNALGQRVFKTEPLFASGSGSGGTTSGKNLNNLLADPEDQEAEQDKGLIQSAYEFFTRLWRRGSSDAQKLGFAYVYGNDGTLLGQYGMGGSNSTGTTQYIYLPTADGPMSIAAIVNGVAYAVHSDHLNTPRKLTQPDGQVAWQWGYSAFGDTWQWTQSSYAVPRLSHGRGRRGRVQRQVHGQPVRAARGLVRYAGGACAGHRA